MRFRPASVVQSIVLSSLLFASSARAEPHSTVSAATYPEGQKLRMDVKISFPSNLHLNTEAPWSFEIKSAPGLDFAQTKLKVSDLDKGFPGFHLVTTGKPSQASGSVGFVVTAFVCTNDKTLCYRDVMPGTVSWKSP